MRSLFYSAFALCFLVSCDEGDFEYSKFHSLSGQKITYDDTLRFEYFVKKDTLHQFYISIRYTDQYEFSNIWLKSLQEGQTSRIDIPLFDKFGQPLGQCTGGLCTQTIFWKEENLNSTDTVRIEMIQNMRKNPLLNISEVGLMIK